MTLKNMTATILLGSMVVLIACGGGVIRDVPLKPDVGGKYIFYLHGSVEEYEGSTEKYQAALTAISSNSVTVVSEIRGDTDPKNYAEKLENQVNTLISKGVPARNITVSGFSKGAIIALAAAGAINNENINYVLVAGCSEYLNDKYGVVPEKAVGRILSIYDLDDDKFGSCDRVIKDSPKLVYKEIALVSGKGHKVFRIPKDKFIHLWRDPLLDWAGV